MLNKVKSYLYAIKYMIGVLIILRAEGGLSGENSGNYHMIGTRGGCLPSSFFTSHKKHTLQ